METSQRKGVRYVYTHSKILDAIIFMDSFNIADIVIQVNMFILVFSFAQILSTVLCVISHLMNNNYIYNVRNFMLN